MRKDNGITLTSLIVYVVVMIIVLVIMSSIITNFYSNTDSVYANVEDAVEFNKFNMYFLKEVKLYDNAVDTINLEKDMSYILFTSGNAFVFKDNKIYYNNIEVCDKVKSLSFEYGKTTNDTGEMVEDSNIIKVEVALENFSKTINYKLENIY